MLEAPTTTIGHKTRLAYSLGEHIGQLTTAARQLDDLLGALHKLELPAGLVTTSFGLKS